MATDRNSRTRAFKSAAGSESSVKGLAPSASAAREPLGRDRAVTKAGAPPRPKSRTSASPAKPLFPSGESVQLPRNVVKEIERQIADPGRAKEIALALSIGSAAIDADAIEVAMEHLSWAKSQVPRIPSVREAFGVALYLSGDFAAAVTELQTYRRITGRTDQNHLIADCFRALGRDIDQIAELAESLIKDASAPIDRRTEAAIIWASAVADNQDVRGARAVLRRFADRTRIGDGEHYLRFRYLEADLAARDGAVDEARGIFEEVLALDGEWLDIADRIRELNS